jgi:hypothetical protein
VVPVEPFQAEVARIALAAASKHGFALAGGNALVAHGIVNRPTEDVDLFSPEPGAPGAVGGQVVVALRSAGYLVEVARAPESTGGEFARLTVKRGADVMNLDLARDWRQLPPVDTELGPVLALDDAVGSKVTAMIGRGLPRDYIDVGAALSRYDRADLIILAFSRDPGLRVIDLGEAMARLDGLGGKRFADYGLDAAAVGQLRTRFAHWPRTGETDPEAEAAWLAVRATEPASQSPPVSLGGPTSSPPDVSAGGPVA